MVTPVTTVVGVKGNVQFTATGVFTDNSTQDLSSQAAWSSSVASVALISNTGLDGLKRRSDDDHCELWRAEWIGHA